MVEARIKIAKSDIIKTFENLSQKILTSSDIDRVLSSNRDSWRLRKMMTLHEFTVFMLDETKLKKVELDFPNRKVIRYAWGKVPLYELLMGINKTSYFSHFSAMYFHRLTEQIPKTIYLNQEQKPKPQYKSGLTQERIDNAFKRPTRTSQNFIKHEGRNIYLLSGKCTDNLGVIETNGPENESIRVTNVERTLIDITVRPVYAGGVFEVLKSYRLSQPRVSINKLVATLKKLDYVYPYHQVIGFYLKKAGNYSNTVIELLRKFDFEYDFYLAHNIKETSYSPEWKLHYPKGF
ncbi:MAG: type IV toxin-antitoxin system AbiEi family antitoxin domain-containing protein [Planctomycetota bacterium]